MVSRAAFLLFPVLVLAQSTPGTAPATTHLPPSAVDKALRARVNEFFQYHVDGTFMKALDLVAEDTKEFYFNQAKVKLTAFKIDDIKYTDDNFNKAIVTTTIKRMWKLQGTENEVQVPMTTGWKVENDKWVWYHDEAVNPWITPMGPSDIPGMKRGMDGSVELPKDMSEAAARTAAESIIKQSTMDRQIVTLTPEKPSTDQLVFHNGNPGWLLVSLSGTGQVPGLTTELSKTTLGRGEDAIVKFKYEPAGKLPEKPVMMWLKVEPLGLIFDIEVRFNSPAAPAK